MQALRRLLPHAYTASSCTTALSVRVDTPRATPTRPNPIVQRDRATPANDRTPPAVTIAAACCGC
ncbi:MAG: hypothetical protein JSS03_11340 [Proteobacteria bacterium]|nr:hypothetical protein [Pseudomonadota bacterium]